MKKGRFYLAGLLTAVFLLQPLSALGEESLHKPSPWAAESMGEVVALGFVPEEFLRGYQWEITRKEFAEVALRFLTVQYNYYDGYGADLITWVNRFLSSPQGAGKLTLTKADCFALVPEEKRETWGQDPEEWDWDSLLHWMEPFSDMDPDEGFYCINSAYLLGIINGREDGTFGPDDPITRQEAACMLERTYRVYAGEDTAFDAAAALTSFTDREAIGTWAEESVALMVQNGVMKGVEEGLFSPTTGYTREQCYVTFLRLYENMPTSRGRENVDRLCTREEELAKIRPGGFLVRADVCFENELATVVLAYYGGLPRGASYNRFFIVYEAGGRREVGASPWTERGSFRPSDDGEGAVYKSGYEEYRLDLRTGKSVLLTPTQ